MTRHPHLNFIQADAHEIEVKAKFDVIILSDIVNDLWDAQQIFGKLYAISHPGTRLILNFYNNLWRMPLSMVKRLGLGADVLEQNWFSPNDIFNLLELSGFEVIQHRPGILFPLSVPGLSTFANRYLVNIVPFSWLALTNFVIARPINIASRNLSKEKPSVSVIIPARNEAGNIENILRCVPTFGGDTELVFVEGTISFKVFISFPVLRKPKATCL